MLDTARNRRTIAARLALAGVLTRGLMMKKKAFKKLQKGEKLVVVEDCPSLAPFKKGDVVVFDIFAHSSQKSSPKGLFSECSWLLGRKEVELYVEPKQTRREQLIAAGVPADELAKIVDDRLNGEAVCAAYVSLFNAFEWKLSPQGAAYWIAWNGRLLGHGVAIPEPLDAAPELYCVVFGDDNRMCSINGSEVAHTSGTFDVCNNTAKSMRRLFPDNTYRVMRLVPVEVKP